MDDICVDKLEKVGLKAASNRIKELKEYRRKMTIAYEHFRYLEQDKIDAFNKKLREESIKEDKNSRTYKCLKFIPLGEYEEVPPMEVLDKLEAAQDLGCFDTFEIAKIQDIKEVKDPMVFGRIYGCPDCFFISQWDDDVRIEDILKENEG